jgi:hypothetical protein
MDELVEDIAEETVLPGEYISGPIPVSWIGPAMREGGNACVVAMLIWHYWKLRTGRPVRVSMCKCQAINMGRRARNSALAKLADMGLIEIDAHRDRAPVVRVIRK